MDSTIKLIVFDLGNTVIRFDHHISARKIGLRFGLDVEKVYQLFFDSPVSSASDRGDLTPKEFHRAVMAELGIAMPYEEFAAIWSDIFWEDEGVTAILRRLKERYPLALLSNINLLHWEFINKKFPVTALFDSLTLSYEVGCVKPDRRIYEAAARRHHVTFADMLYIDDREDLIVESTKLGIPSIRFTTAANLEASLAQRAVL